MNQVNNKNEIEKTIEISSSFHNSYTPLHTSARGLQRRLGDIYIYEERLISCRTLDIFHSKSYNKTLSLVLPRNM